MQRHIFFTGTTLLLFASACAIGSSTGVRPSSGKTKDAGAAPAAQDSGPKATNDGGTTEVPDASTCDLTTCGGLCVDTSSDDNNCGGCFNVCGAGTSCVGGVCQGTTTTNAPPQGSCAHDLCSASGYLTPGCDPAGCVANVCNSDSFCCDSTSGNWDGTCVGEVATYCAPYSCK